MEALFFLIDSVVILVVAYYGLMDERRPRGAPARSPFRYFEDGATSNSIAAARKAETQARRSAVEPRRDGAGKVGPR